MKSQLQFDDVDLESCLGELFGIRRLEGKRQPDDRDEGVGRQRAALTRTLTGTAGLTARQGAITGFNVEQLLKRLEQRPLSIAGDFRRGRTPYEKLNVTIKIADGIASVDDVKLEGGAIRLAVAGSASIPTRDLDLKGTAALVNTRRRRDPAVRTALRRAGPLGRPDHAARRAEPDPPLRRRRAAARRRARPQARDAVRSAIDQLNRDGMAPASASSVPVAPPLPLPLRRPRPSSSPARSLLSSALDESGAGQLRRRSRHGRAPRCDAGEGRGGVADRRHDPRAFRHHGRPDPARTSASRPSAWRSWRGRALRGRCRTCCSAR